MWNAKSPQILLATPISTHRRQAQETSIWEQSKPDHPTYTAGATDDTIVLTLGNYLPDGVLPPVRDIETGGESIEYFPAYVANKPIVGDHMALSANRTKFPRF